MRDRISRFFVILLLFGMSFSTAYADIEDEILEEDEEYVRSKLEYVTDLLDSEKYVIIDSRVREIRDLYSFEIELEAGIYYAWMFGGYEIVDIGIFAYNENNIEIAGNNNAKPDVIYDVYEELYGDDSDIPEIQFNIGFTETVTFEIEVFEFFSDRYETYQPSRVEEFYERGYIGFILAKAPE